MRKTLLLAAFVAAGATIVPAAAPATAQPTALAAQSPDRDGPNQTYADYFCRHTELWRVGARFSGINNRNLEDSWTVDDSLDDPHQTEFLGHNSVGIHVRWYC
jgi:hypothetical protein